MPRSWIIGAEVDCDLVVDLPKVSGHHCRLTLDGDRFSLEDLGSTNGTFVNGERVVRTVPISRSDVVTLGLVTPMPWPATDEPPAPVVIRIGREVDNDFVVDLPSVSAYHARVLWEEKPGRAVIEDLDSSNGTAINSPDRKIKRAELTPLDTIYLGSNPIPASQLLARVSPSVARPLVYRGKELTLGRDPGCDLVADLPTISNRHARLSGSGGKILLEDLNSASGTFVEGRRVLGPALVKDGDLISFGGHTFRLAVAAPVVEPPRAEAEEVPWILPLDDTPSSLSIPSESAQASGWPIVPAVAAGLLAAAPVLAFLLVVLLKGDGGGAASLLSWLGISVVALGMADAILGLTIGLGPGPLWNRRGMPARIGFVAGIAAAQALICWGVVAGAGILQVTGAASALLLILAALVGVGWGVFAVAVLPGPVPAWSVLPVAFLVLSIFGGHAWPIPRIPGPLHALAGLVPSRWVFEGLLLIQEEGGKVSEAAEAYFPAETHRMGTAADALALALMAVGLGVASAIIRGDGMPASLQVPRASSSGP